MRLFTDLMDVRRLLNTPPRRRLPSKILEAPPLPLPLSQLSTHSWNSQNEPRPSRESSFTSGRSQSNLPRTPKKQQYAPTLTRTDRIRIKTAFDFNISPEEIRKKYGNTISQIQGAKTLQLTPQVHRRGRKPKKLLHLRVIG
jgi:hypothetical protein